jgi:uncharacterized protein (TIGR00369 family)
MSAAFEPRFAGWEQRVRDSFAQQGAMAHIGARVSALVPGRCTVEVDFRAELSQQHGFFHAGITTSVSDSAGGYAALTLFPAESEVLTVELKINLLAPAGGRLLVAEGRVVRSGRTLTICTVEVFVERGGGRHQCALMQQTLIRVGHARAS